MNNITVSGCINCPFGQEEPAHAGDEHLVCFHPGVPDGCDNTIARPGSWSYYKPPTTPNWCVLRQSALTVIFDGGDDS